jgi:hypothetical protein
VTASCSFLATFPFENQSPEEAASDDWLIGVAVGVLLVGLLVTLAVALRTPWAVAAYAGGMAGGGALLPWAITLSEHSGGKRLLWGSVVELTGLAAVAFSRAVSRRPA